MIAPSLAHLAQLPLMKTYSTEELHKIQMFLRDGTITEGLEWILEKKDYVFANESPCIDAWIWLSIGALRLRST
jgi:hypothetical protein